MSDIDMTANSEAEDTIRDEDEVEVPESELALVKKIQAKIRSDLTFHERAFMQMRRDMFVARYGRTPDWARTNYKANIAGRQVRQKTAALYAKNPRIVAKRRETLDFVIWDERPSSLQMALQTIQMAQQMLAQAPKQIDPSTGQPVPPAPPPELEQAFNSAMALMQDYQQGMERRRFFDKLGKTLEVLFTQALREQKPVDFKTAAKQLVRRTATTGVGYIELGFQRQKAPRPGLTEQLADARSRLDHMRRLVEEVGEGEIEPDDPEMAELQSSIGALMAEPEIVLREGLVIDFPQSTRVIPDQLCRDLIGFLGARHITVEYLFTKEQVEELFDVDLKANFTGYVKPAVSDEEKTEVDGPEQIKSAVKGSGMVRVWKMYDKDAGLAYYVADGYDRFLRKPAAPDVFVEDFWPIYALTFNAVESEDHLFPPSDVYLMTDQQMEINRSRQGKRDHRLAAMPRWAAARGSIESDDAETIQKLKPFETAFLGLPPGATVADVLTAFPVPGVDPNLYDTGEVFSDIQLIVGSSEARFGGTAQATATESAIAAGSSKSADDASIDDLDSFLTVVARAGGQILLREMSKEQVMKVAGPGAVWVDDMPLEDIASEVFLEVAAGSSGKPNQAVEVQNFKELAPILLQTPGISPTWMAREAVKRLDDKADLTEALTEDIPAIVAQNRMQQMAPPEPENDPQAQGAEGANNGPQPPSEQSAGSDAAFGSNQV